METIAFGKQGLADFLAGKRTQTRRLVRSFSTHQAAEFKLLHPEEKCDAPVECVVDVGDVMAVQEPYWHLRVSPLPGVVERSVYLPGRIWLCSDGEERRPPAPSGHEWAERFATTLHPMACRYRARVTGVRLARVQEGSIRDWRACGYTGKAHFGRKWNRGWRTAGCRWKDNPWVWVIGFEVAQ